jgi:hypothetical protein
MQKILFAAFAAASLFAAPAFAQSGTNSDHTTSNNQNPSGNVAPNQTAAQIRQKIANDLEQNGFTQVHVVPNSFLVHAVNKQGEPMVMIIDPDSVFSVTEAGPNRSAKNTNTNTGAAKTTQQ